MKRDVVNWAFMGLLAFFAGRLVASVDALNLEMAKVITLVGTHEKRLDNLEKN